MDVCFLMRLVLNRNTQYLFPLGPHLTNADRVRTNIVRVVVQTGGQEI